MDPVIDMYSLGMPIYTYKIYSRHILLFLDVASVSPTITSNPVMLAAAKHCKSLLGHWEGSAEEAYIFGCVNM